MTNREQLTTALLFLIGTTLPTAIRAPFKAPPAPRNPNELHIVGNGINVFFPIPDEGTSLSKLLAEFQLSDSTPTILLERAGESNYPKTVSLTMNDCTIPAGSAIDVHVVPADTLWLLDEHGFPFPNLRQPP